jgi:predicted RNase H-like HicB family nuclease
MISGQRWQSKKDGFWLAEVRYLDLMVQGADKDEVVASLAEAIELLVNQPAFSVHVAVEKNRLTITANDSDVLEAYAQKRQRIRGLRRKK